MTSLCSKWGHHPVVAAVPEMAKRIRKELGLSLNGAAELAGMSPLGLAKFESRKAGGRSETVGSVCRGMQAIADKLDERIGALRRLQVCPVSDPDMAGGVLMVAIFRTAIMVVVVLPALRGVVVVPGSVFEQARGADGFGFPACDQVVLGAFESPKLPERGLQWDGRGTVKRLPRGKEDLILLCELLQSGCAQGSSFAFHSNFVENSRTVACVLQVLAALRRGKAPRIALRHHFLRAPQVCLDALVDDGIHVFVVRPTTRHQGGGDKREDSGLHRGKPAYCGASRIISGLMMAARMHLSRSPQTHSE